MGRKMKLNTDIWWPHHQASPGYSKLKFSFQTEITKIYLHVETLVCRLCTSLACNFSLLHSKSLGCCMKVERKGELYPDSPSLFFGTLSPGELILQWHFNALIFTELHYPAAVTGEREGGHLWSTYP